MDFALFGTGFWSRYQLAAWNELPDPPRCVALYNRTRSKAEALAAEFGVDRVYDDPGELFDHHRLDFADIVTDVNSHRRFVELSAARGVPVVCQKPLAPTLEEARQMHRACEAAGVPFFVHENWRWQSPIRALKTVLDSGRLGRLVRARIDYAHSYPVFDNQPFLKELDQFILTDVGTHILDAARFLFGEATSLYCQTRRIHPDIKGEDVATVMMRMGNDNDGGGESGLTVTANLSYASRWDLDRFPETFVAVEGTDGGASLNPGHVIRVTTRDGVEESTAHPPTYPWADPDYALVHASIVDCHRDLLAGLSGGHVPETTAADNLRTLELVFGAYQSAAGGLPVATAPDQSHGRDLAPASPNRPPARVPSPAPPKKTRDPNRPPGP